MTPQQIVRKDLNPRQKVRFMWFGGEEDGLIGSTYYAEHLSQDEADKIMVMIATDMISSANFARFVHDGNGSQPDSPAGPPGSGEVDHHDFCDRLSSILGAPPPEVLAAPLAAAAMQGGGERSMRQFLPAVTHAIWRFARERTRCLNARRRHALRGSSRRR